MCYLVKPTVDTFKEFTFVPLGFVPLGFVPLSLGPRTMEYGLNEGIWDPKPKVTHIKGTNLKSVIPKILRDLHILDVYIPTVSPT